MASIPFPVDLFPLVQGAGTAEHDTGIVRDAMDDGTPRARVMQSVEFLKLPLSFEPLSSTRATALIAYLRSNITQEFTFDYLGDTWEGILWSNPTSERVDAQWWIKIDFYGGVI